MMRAQPIFLLFLASALLCYSQDPQAGSAVPAAALPSVMPGRQPNSYIIGPSDVLTVTVWKQPTLSGNLVVRPDGMVSLPLLGDVQASGTTPSHLADVIAIGLRKYFVDPSVSVELTQMNSKKIYLLGEVQKPGPVDMTPGMTLLQAIASAGGPTDYAKKGKIYILRGEAGKQQRVPVHYKDALRGRGQANVALQPSDTIVVP
jgi:polysaccharide export outer membrane protein